MQVPGESAMRGRRLAMGVVAVLAAVAAGCSDAADPSGGPLAVAVGLTVEAAAGGPAEAYAQADAIAVTVRAGGVVVYDETQSFSPEDGETRVRVRLDASLAGSTVTVDAELRASGAPIFRGTGSTTLEAAGASALNVPLTAVVSAIVATNPVASFTAIGETLPLTAAAVFATGDTVGDVALTWRSLDASIVSVTSSGSATAQAEGTARLEASAGGATAATTALVAAQVVRVTVAPPSATVSVEQSTTFTAQAFDRNSNPLTRMFDWSTSSPTIATVTGAGVATGVGSGVANIVAAAGGAQGSAVLTVVDVPVGPGGLAGTILNEAALTYRLTWEDRSSNESYFSIERSVDGGAYVQVGQVEPGVTAFQGMGVTGENAFRVLACNTIGCSIPSNVVRLTFVGGPPVATTQESPDIGVMAGTVTGATPYTAWFQFGYDESDFGEGSEGECPCYEETTPVSGVGTQSFQVPVELWYSEYPLYYRIVARNEFGESVGQIESTTFPNVRTRVSSGFWDYGSSNTFFAELSGPSGTFSNPIQSVTFEVIGFNPPYNDVLVSSSPVISDTGSTRTYTYSRTWTAPSSDAVIGGFVYVDVIVTFRSGASLYAPFLTMSPGGGSIR